MKKYHKIETIYSRDNEGTKKLLPGVFRDPTIKFLQFNNWEWTEKVDGTNIRIYWNGHTVTFGGRTDNAQIPAPLVNRLNELFGGPVNEEIFEQCFGENEIILFGEGYGAGIQKGGGNYISNGVDFILFDVLIGDNYQSRKTVEAIAKLFNIRVVPIVGVGNLMRAVEFVQSHPNSEIAEKTREMEGIVCRPEMELRDRCGNRIIVKIKWEDFKNQKVGMNLYICPTCRKLFDTEEKIVRHSLKCWKQHNPDCKSTPAPCKGNISTQEMSEDIQKFFSEWSAINGRS